MKYEKVFVIGFNKTGTNSLNELFLDLGLSSTHTTDWKYDKYTCFTDGWKHAVDGPDNFKMLNERFPNSLFILNTRPLSHWLLSRVKHGILYKRDWAWPISHDKFVDWINSRYTHHNDVLNFFKTNPQKLLVVNINNNNWVPLVASELGFPDCNKVIHAYTIPENKIPESDLALTKNMLSETFKVLNIDGSDQERLDIDPELVRLYKNNLS